MREGATRGYEDADGGGSGQDGSAQLPWCSSRDSGWFPRGGRQRGQALSLAVLGRERLRMRVTVSKGEAGKQG